MSSPKTALDLLQAMRDKMIDIGERISDLREELEYLAQKRSEMAGAIRQAENLLGAAARTDRYKGMTKFEASKLCLADHGKIT